MRRRLIFGNLLALVTALAASGVEIHRAQQFAAGPDDAFAEQILVVAQHIDFKGTANDDAFFLGGPTVTITGKLMNDVWAFGRSVHVAGHIGDHARLLANTITYAGSVKSSLTAAGSTIQIMTNATVGGSLNLFGENIIVEGEVMGGSRLMGQRVTLAGRLHDDVSVAAEDIVVLAGALIEGNLTYTSGRELILSKDVQLKGKLIRKEPVKPTPEVSRDMFLQSLTFQALLCVSAIVTGMAFVGIFPQAAGNAVRLVRTAPWRCALAGAAGFCLIPLLAIALLFTLVGIPLSILLMLGYMILVYISQFSVALTLGSLFLRRRGRQSFGQIVLALITGLVLLYIMALMPIIGMTVLMAALLIGLGAILIAVLGQQQGATTPPSLPGASEN